MQLQEFTIFYNLRSIFDNLYPPLSSKFHGEREGVSSLVVADLGGGGGARRADAFPLSDSIPCRPKGSPLCSILRYLILVKYRKMFLKAPSVPKYINFEGSKFSKKYLKCLFSPVFFFQLARMGYL